MMKTTHRIEELVHQLAYCVRNNKQSVECIHRPKNVLNKESPEVVEGENAVSLPGFSR